MIACLRKEMLIQILKLNTATLTQWGPCSDEQTPLQYLLFALLRSTKIAMQFWYLLVYLHPYYLELGYKKGNCPYAEIFYEAEIILTMHVNLNIRQIEKISNLIRNFFKS